MRRCTILLCGWLTGCGGDDRFAPGVGDDPGTGTATLTVRGRATAHPVVANAMTAGDFVTDFAVEVERDGARVASGEVTVTAATGAVPLTFDTRDGGVWRGQAAGYHEVYQLDVIAGGDQLVAVRVDGPDRHQFIAPMHGATVDATAPLAVGWARAAAAPRATVQTRRLPATDVDDTGSLTLPTGSLTSQPDASEHEELWLRRSAEVAPAGAVTGSRWTVEVDNRIELVVAPAGP